MTIPSRCIRRDNPHHVCNCDCDGYEARIAELEAEVERLRDELRASKTIPITPICESCEYTQHHADELDVCLKTAQIKLAALEADAKYWHEETKRLEGRQDTSIFGEEVGDGV